MKLQFLSLITLVVMLISFDSKSSMPIEVKSNDFQEYQNEVIYGEDNRLESYIFNSTTIGQQSHSVAAMIPKKFLKKKWFSASFYLTGDGLKTLNDYGVCSYERFSSQYSSSVCSGFLVDDDKILTAGHCVENFKDCRSYYWVFNYEYQSTGLKLKKLYRDKVFRCQKIIAREQDLLTGKDYALIKLNRKVKFTSPLELNDQNLKIDSKLYTIGHPIGLPKKISTDGLVLEMSKNQFKTDLDAFQGSSGSPVFDFKTGKVEGILVAGNIDFFRDPVNQCQKYNRCKNFPCTGEDVLKISSIKDILNKYLNK